MADLKIRVLKGPDQQPKTTVTIPGGIPKIASNLLPNKAAEALREEGIDLDELVRLAQNPEAKGNLVEIEDHEKNQKIIVSLE